MRQKCDLRFIALAFILAPSLTLAQTTHAPESVTVTGTRSREVLQDFVQSFAAPARITGKLVRWERGICPLTMGLRPQAVTFINRRLKEIAIQTGAPVDSKANCKPNIEIIFTTTPQGLMDWVRQKHPTFLGYHDNSRQADRLALVTRPIQAWYTTATRDAIGNLQLDARNVGGGGVTMAGVTFPDAKTYAVTGARTGDGLRSGFHHVIIAIDPNKLVTYEIGSLADYIAMLALTQPSSFDICQQLPSIVNLLTENCDRKAGALTENDIAFLRGLYQMSADKKLGTQQDEVAYRMEQELTH
jgi:hypothetical protein